MASCPILTMDCFVFSHRQQSNRATVQWFLPCPCTYLIFVISFTQAKFSENKIYTEKHRKLQKRISRQNSVNQNLLGQATKNCVKLHTECKSTLGLCKNKIIHTNYTKCVKLHTECKCCVMLDGCK